MKYLIVNADDFGLTAGVNRAVIEGHTGGIITSATLMVNMPAFDEAAQLARAHRTLGTGLHFNITQGRPVAPVSQVRSLVGETGEFLGTTTALAWRALAGRLRPAEVVVELRAQLERALEAGLVLTHVDSHKHSHAIPLVCSAIIETIGDYGINAVRSPRERWEVRQVGRPFESRRLITQALGSFGIAQLCRISAARLEAARVRTTDAFHGVTRTGFWTRPWLLDLIRSLPEGVSELMCHPGYQDPQLGAVKTRLRESRVTELRLLTDPEVRALVRECPVQLVDYSFS
ncbi:MAG TPA: ChbG/HpnK family deacetylase [Blastocatellia bacterium]|nr:ChbG/HpnK family deacetylase [Blastocatellia bacterium]